MIHGSMFVETKLQYIFGCFWKLELFSNSDKRRIVIIFLKKFEIVVQFFRHLVQIMEKQWEFIRFTGSK